MKFILLIIFTFFTEFTFAEPIFYRLDVAKKCFVKRYKDKKFTSVNPKRFYQVRIFAKPHKRNEKYSVFRYENEIYVTYTSCLNPGSLEDEGDDLFDSEKVENNAYLNRATTRSGLVDSLRFSENKYFVELNGGVLKINGSKSIFPYQKLNGIDQDGDDFQTSDAEKSNYKTGPSFSIGGGYRLNDYQFLAMKARYFEGSKKEIVPTSINAGPIANIPFDYRDKFASVLIGTKFLFLEEYRIKPVLAGYLGLNQISSTQRIGSSSTLKYQSLGLAAVVEAGFEMLLTPNLGLGITGGYEYLSNKKFTIKEKEDSSREEGFSSGINYSNTFINLGLRVYFR